MTLKERMLKLRQQYEVTLPSQKYIMCMIDGKNFSKLIKNFFIKPFDEDFIYMMNKTAIYVCEKIQYSCFAYVQSDEITFVFTPLNNDQLFYGNRITKLLSIIPSTATAKFNQLMIKYNIQESINKTNFNNIEDIISNTKLAEFDCKAWSVDNLNDVYSYFLWRQIDCIRNSKQQTAQTWLSHKVLDGLNTDKQIELLLKEKGIDWNKFEDYKKYGRFIYKEKEMYHNDTLNIDYERSVWKVHDGFPISGDGKVKFLNLGIIPNIDD